MRSYSFITVDVFTDQPFGGNPLAVFPDARGISAEEMQHIAAEINYSEITFVLPPADSANTARVRIFTPRNEVPFAGHPNVGTGFVLGGLGRARRLADGREVMRFEEAAGLVELELIRTAAGSVGAVRIAAPQRLTKGHTVPAEAIAECLSVGAGDIDTAAHRPMLASVGLPFIIAELRSLDALERCAPNYGAFAHCNEHHGYAEDRFSIHAYVRLREGASANLQARMFAPLSGILEDPATGSANAALVALLADLAPAPDAKLECDVLQGVEMGRPSRLSVAAEKRAGSVERVLLSGGCVEMIRGELTLRDR
jgi:trans-2,3-dihydro-3-hydroxyanthranilate isomerase